MDKTTPQELTRILQKYKSGKSALERRVISAENWWKLRNRSEESRSSPLAEGEGFRSASGWLHNVIVSKHADAMEAFPEPRILPRESSDSADAEMLSAVIPCILEQNRFEKVYSDAMWQKLKTGTGVYRVAWDASKLGGLGDISVERVDLLNVFWEPGVDDIQKSRYFFHTHLEDNDALCEKYPQLVGRLKSAAFRASRFVYDDSVPTDGKSTVVEAYYRRRGVLHYCKYVGDTVLYSTEDETAAAGTSAAEEAGEPAAPRGLYDHGRYPFVFDPLFPVEGTPCGYGFVDLCRSVQTSIDLMRTAFVRNAVTGATPRYFERIDGSVNEEEFADLSKSIVHVSGNLGEDSLRQIGFVPMSGVYVSVLNSAINELRETSGNTETATGTVHSGVTAASAIAALQEASGKGSRDCTRASYLAFAEIVELCIELIRQFYTLPRQFRITGPLGGEEFVSFSNAALVPQDLGSLGGVELGQRLPVFDIRVEAQKRSAYSRLSQNELAMELYRMGFFAPGNEDTAAACLAMMDFDGRGELMRSLARSSETRRRLEEGEGYRALALALMRRYRPDMAAGLGLPPEGADLPPLAKEEEAAP